MPQVALTRPKELILRGLDRDPFVFEKQETHLREVRELDALIRKTHRLEVVTTATVPARTWTQIRFPNDQVELTIFRRLPSLDNK
jgi:hypothetical protein